MGMCHISKERWVITASISSIKFGLPLIGNMWEIFKDGLLFRFWQKRKIQKNGLYMLTDSVWLWIWHSTHGYLSYITIKRINYGFNNCNKIWFTSNRKYVRNIQRWPSLLTYAKTWNSEKLAIFVDWFSLIVNLTLYTWVCVIYHNKED